MSDNEQVVLTDEDKGLIRAYLTVFYKQAQNWNINNKMAGIVDTMIRESK